MRKCSVCMHKDLAKINEAIICGDSYRDIARQFHVSKDAVGRHAKGHLPTTLVKAKDASEVASADDLLSQVCSLRDRTLDILSEAETAGKLSVALAAIRTAQGNVELFARLFIAVENQRRADAAGKPPALSAADERLRNMSDVELTRRYFILNEMERHAIDDELEDIENSLTSKGGLSSKDAKTLEGRQRKLIKKRNYIVNNIECMRLSIARDLKRDGDDEPHDWATDSLYSHEQEGE